jgi:hypothetical protein
MKKCNNFIYFNLSFTLDQNCIRLNKLQSNSNIFKGSFSDIIYKDFSKII